MDEKIKKVRNLNGYKMDNLNIAVMCYVDDIVLIARNEDDLQRLLN